MTITLSVIALYSLRDANGQERGQGVVKIKVESGKEIDLYRESHALVIGASAYAKGWPSLPGTGRDVREVTDTLKQHGFQVETLSNPTRAAFDQAIRRFIRQHGQAENNRLLIYFAGHGHTLKTVDGRSLGYIVPVDAPNPNRDSGAFKEIAVSMDEIEVYARQIEAKHALFVFDSCFSGSLFEPTRAVPPAIAERTARPVRQFITAGTAEQEVPDNSLFRAQFIEGLQGEADLNGDGFITGSELGVFLEDKVTNYSNRAQTPRWGKIRNPNLDKGDFVFALKSPGPPPRRPVDPCAKEEDAWNQIRNSRNATALRAFLREYPNCQYASNARILLAALESPPPVESATPSTSPAATQRLIVPTGIQMKIRLESGFNTKHGKEGDRLTFVVLDPTNYADALIEGHIARLTKSINATGKTELLLSFNQIHLRDRSKGRFAAQVERVYQSKAVRIINKKGNNVRNGLGVGVSNGSIFIQGENDLALDSGAEILIRTMEASRR